ncbi:hypothetical protein M1384_04025 [Candidatus Parvarchaeota archaeon]|nr:hypothetical protein [Candidatus Parvarchaeota archaeon]MCL5976445.1 hypothetical protein [Candidatus Parvarchaeota archaeon]
MQKYSNEVKAEARELVKSGLSRTEAARRLGFSSNYVYNLCLDIPLKRSNHYPQEMVERARKLASEGISKLLISKELSVSYQWVKEHLYDINASKALSKETIENIKDLFMMGISKTDISKKLRVSPTTVGKYTPKVSARRRFDPEIGKKAIAMVRSGLGRESTAAILGVSYKFVWNRTKRIKRDGNVIFGKRMLKILGKLLLDGFYFARRNEIPVCRYMTGYLPIKLVVYRRKFVFVAPGREQGAIAELVARYYHNHIGSRRLNRIIDAFSAYEYRKYLLKKTKNLRYIGK